MDDFHGTAAEYIRRANDQRVANFVGQAQGFVFCACRAIGRLLQAEALQQLLEALAVFGRIDHVRRGTDDRHAVGFEVACQLQRRLAAVLDNDPNRLFDVHDLEHVFQRQRLKVEAIRGVVVGGHGLRIAVDHDRLVAVFAHGERSMDAAVVEFDALADAVRTAAQDHDFLLVGRIRLALFLVGRVHVSSVRGEFGGTGINALVDRTHAQLVAMLTHGGLCRVQQLGQTLVGETGTLEHPDVTLVQRSQFLAADGFGLDVEILDLGEKPRIDCRQAENVVERHARTEGIEHIPQALRARLGELGLDHFAVGGDFVETIDTDFQTTQGLVQRFLQGAADSHHFADGLHLRRQARIGGREFLEGETRHLGDHVVDRRLERGRGLAAGDLVGQFVQRVADGQLGRDLGDRETGRLGGQCRRTRNPRVHLDDDHAAISRADRELYVRTAGIDADLAQHGDRGVAHDLVFTVGQRLRRGDGDRVTGMHAHRVKVLDRADDDAVVRLVADHFHLVFLPAEQAFLDQQFAGRRSLETALADLDKLFLVVGDATAGTAHREGWADDRRKADHGLHLLRLFHRVRNGRTGRAKTDLGHRRLELLAVLSLVDGFTRSADHFDAELFEHAMLGQVERTVQRRLAAHGRQQRVRALLLDDLLDDFPGNRLDVGDIGHFRVGHDRGRIGVDQNDLITLFAQRLAGLCAGVVEFAGLTDDDRAGTDDEDALYVCTLGHGLLSLSLLVLHGFGKTVEQVGHVVRTGAGFRVSLEREGRHVGAGHALQRTIEQRDVRRPQVGRQRIRINGKSVVLAGDQHLLGIEILDRVIGTVVTELHLHCLRAGGKCQQLVAQANAVGRHAACEKLANGRNGVVAGLGVTRAVGQEDAVRIHCQHLGRRRLCRHDGNAAATLGQHAQDIALDAKIVGNDVELGFRHRLKAGQRPFPLAPLVGRLDGDDLRQIHAGKTGEGFCFSNGLGLINRSGHDATGLGALFAQHAGQRTGIDAGDGNDAMLLEIVRQGVGHAPVRGADRQIADDQASGKISPRLPVFIVATGIADVRIGQRDDLAAIGRVSQDFLVAGHGGVEHHLATRGGLGANGKTAEHGTVG